MRKALDVPASTKGLTIRNDDCHFGVTWDFTSIGIGIRVFRCRRPIAV